MRAKAMAVQHRQQRARREGPACRTLAWTPLLAAAALALASLPALAGPPPGPLPVRKASSRGPGKGTAPARDAGLQPAPPAADGGVADGGVGDGGVADGGTSLSPGPGAPPLAGAAPQAAAPGGTDAHPAAGAEGTADGARPPTGGTPLAEGAPAAPAPAGAEGVATLAPPEAPPAAPCPPAPAGWRQGRRSGAEGVEERVAHAAVWTGREMLVFGGSALGVDALATGGAYAPAADAWRTLAPAPSPRGGHGAVWSGQELLVFGGYESWGWPPAYKSDGLAYAPDADAWRALPAAPLAPRAEPAVVFATTTGELLVWGGSAPRESRDGPPPARYADGAAFHPGKGTWRPLAASPLSARSGHAAVWTGSHMLVYGGETGPEGQPASDAAAYDPRADRWQRIAVPPEVALRRGGAHGFSPAPGVALLTAAGGSGAGDGVRYDARSGTWTRLPAPGDGVLPVRSGSSLVWGAGRLWVVGGQPPDAGEDLADGAAFTLTTGAWSRVPPAPAPLHRASAVWTGCDLVFYGGTAHGTDRVLLYRP